MNGRLKLAAILLALFVSVAMLPLTGLTFSPLSLVQIDALDTYQSVGSASGKGTVTDLSGGTASFNFAVRSKTSAGPVNGRLAYKNSIGDNVTSDSISSLTILGDTATFDGTCTKNGSPCSFFATAADSSKSGKSDTFNITVSGGPGNEGGILDRGNVQVR